jgi:hypothetical protein
METDPDLERHLDRCARGIHKYQPIEDSDSMVICRYCRQVDEVPDCMFYVSPERTECGQPGYNFVTVTNRAGKYTVPLCREHKAVHDERFASSRTKAAPRRSA